MALEPGQLLEETYRIVRRIGEGGMGEVFEATHARLAGRYAIKLLLREIATDQNLLARFQREAQVTSSLRHPNIVQVVDFRQLADGTSYIVMEFLEGRDLAAELRRGGALALERVGALLDQIASGLAAAHEQGVVHRDLKPANLFLVVLGGSGRELVKIVDFGISKVGARSAQLTRTSAVIGTPQYMSPEQAMGQTDRIDARSDQFSLACIVYEMISGRPPFDGDSVPALMYQLVHVDPAPLQANGQPVAPALEAVVRRALAKQPEARYPSVLAFAHSFATAVADGRSSPREPTLPSAPAPPRTAVMPGGAGVQSGDRGTRLLSEPGGAANTTLRASAAQVVDRTAQDPPPRRRSGPTLALAGGAVAIVAVAVAALALRPGSRPSVAPEPTATAVSAAAPLAARAEPPPAAPPPPATTVPARAPADAEEVSIDVQDAPRGLVVTVDGGEPRAVPVRLRKSSGTHLLVFRAPGYVARPLTLDTGKDLGLVLSLKKISGHAAQGKDSRGAGPAPVGEPTAPKAETKTEPKTTKKRSSAITDL